MENTELSQQSKAGQTAIASAVDDMEFFASGLVQSC